MKSCYAKKGFFSDIYISISNSGQYSILNKMLRDVGFNYIIPLFKIKDYKHCSNNIPEIKHQLRSKRKIKSILVNLKFFHCDIEEEICQLNNFFQKNKNRYG